jgi:methionyl-tRNA formyltransferase
VWQPQRLKKDSNTLNQLRAAQADAFVVVAYGQILSAEILAMPCLGCINAHGSLLPEYRGAAPIQWCLYHGAAVTGVTTMLMDAGMDTGPMLLKGTRPIGLMDNALDLAKDLAAMSADLLVETLEKLNADQVTPLPQDPTQATYAPLIQKEDFTLDWSRSAWALHNQVRGFYPYCTTNFQGNELKISKTVPLGVAYVGQRPEPWEQIAGNLPDISGLEALPPGAIATIVKNAGPVVQTGDGLLLLLEVKPSGKKAQSGWDFANGSRLQVGDRLGR